MGISNNNHVPGSKQFWTHEIEWYTEEVESASIKPWLRTALRSHLIREADRVGTHTIMIDIALDEFFTILEKE